MGLELGLGLGLKSSCAFYFIMDEDNDEWRGLRTANANTIAFTHYPTPPTPLYIIIMTTSGQIPWYYIGALVLMIFVSWLPPPPPKSHKADSAHDDARGDHNAEEEEDDIPSYYGVPGYNIHGTCTGSPTAIGGISS